MSESRKSCTYHDTFWTTCVPTTTRDRPMSLRLSLFFLPSYLFRKKECKRGGGGESVIHGPSASTMTPEHPPCSAGTHCVMRDPAYCAQGLVENSFSHESTAKYKLLSIENVYSLCHTFCDSLFGVLNSHNPRVAPLALNGEAEALRARNEELEAAAAQLAREVRRIYIDRRRNFSVESLLSFLIPLL